MVYVYCKLEIIMSDYAENMQKLKTIITQVALAAGLKHFV